jgi:hypothetical protein
MSQSYIFTFIYGNVQQEAWVTLSWSTTLEKSSCINMTVFKERVYDNIARTDFLAWEQQQLNTSFGKALLRGY